MLVEEKKYTEIKAQRSPRLSQFNGSAHSKHYGPEAKRISLLTKGAINLAEEGGFTFNSSPVDKKLLKPRSRAP